MNTIDRIQAHDSILCRYFCIEFIDCMLKFKSLLEYTNSFSLNEYKKWQNSIKIFSVKSKKVKMMKIYCNVCNGNRAFKNPKI